MISAPKPRPKPERKIYGELLPPLPPAVVAVLKASKLCFLATNENNEPHLSLMNFTYVAAKEVIVLCTRRDTKKFSQIVSNPKVGICGRHPPLNVLILRAQVAILVHDFPHVRFEGEDAESFHGKTW